MKSFVYSGICEPMCSELGNSIEGYTVMYQGKYVDMDLCMCISPVILILGFIGNFQVLRCFYSSYYVIDIQPNINKVSIFKPVLFPTNHLQYVLVLTYLNCKRAKAASFFVATSHAKLGSWPDCYFSRREGLSKYCLYFQLEKL